MSPQQLLTIKRLTNHSFFDILKMSDRQFFANITALLAKRLINPIQHNWLERERYLQGEPETVRNAINIFGGKIIK
jgi:hypothetical protein